MQPYFIRYGLKERVLSRAVNTSHTVFYVQLLSLLHMHVIEIHNALFWANKAEYHCSVDHGSGFSMQYFSGQCTKDLCSNGLILSCFQIKNHIMDFNLWLEYIIMLATYQPQWQTVPLWSKYTHWWFRSRHWQATDVSQFPLHHRQVSLKHMVQKAR